MARRMVVWWLAGVIVTMGVSGCTGTGRSTRAVHQDPDRSVRLESRQVSGEDGSPMRFAHPVPLSEEDWARILGTISVQPQKRFLSSIGAGQAGPRVAFDEDERRYLAGYLREAFSMARPDEWVIFSLNHPREEREDLRGGPGVTEVTSGGLFVEGELLHLMLANYRFAVTIKEVKAQIRGDPLRPAGDMLYELVPGRHQSVHAVTAGGLSGLFRPSLLELTIEYQALLAHPDEKPDELSTSGTRASQSIEDRLRTLQRLREQGLITEEEYRLKRQKLLDQL